MTCPRLATGQGYMRQRGFCVALMSPTAPSLPPFHASGTLGALEIGVLIATCLFGALTVQVYIYYARFPQDPRGIKAIVCTPRSSTKPPSLP